MDGKRDSLLTGPLMMRLNKRVDEAISQIDDIAKSLETHDLTAIKEPASEKEETATIKLHGYRKNKIYNDYYMTYIKEMINELLENKDSFREIEPFEETEFDSKEELNKLKEWRYVVGYSEVKKEPYLPALLTISKFPMASCGAIAQIQKYGHFIFAFNDEYCIIGVPGGEGLEEQPDKGESGFKVWRKMKGSDKYGYWLANIEINTGIITEIS